MAGIKDVRSCLAERLIKASKADGLSRGWSRSGGLCEDIRNVFPGVEWVRRYIYEVPPSFLTARERVNAHADGKGQEVSQP